MQYSVWLTQTLRAGLLFGVCIGVALAVTPKEQKAIVQISDGQQTTLQLQTVPVPQPGENQVLIRVYAAAVNPLDWHPPYRAPGTEAAPTAARSNTIPGKDVAGVVERLGAGATGLKTGDAVFGTVATIPGVLNGGYAEFAVASTATVALKPNNMSFAEAAGLGVAGVTAMRAVMTTDVSKGQRVLITGVAGGVGSFAAQAAKARGAYVIGTASAQHDAYLHSIGVDKVIDYTRGNFEDQVKNVDVVIDTVGSDTAVRALTTVKKGGAYISIAAQGIESKCAAAHLRCLPRNVAGVDRRFFDELVSLAAAGQLKVYVEKTFPLDEAAQAQMLSRQGHTEGKIILIVNASKARKQ